MYFTCTAVLRIDKDAPDGEVVCGRSLQAYSAEESVDCACGAKYTAAITQTSAPDIEVVSSEAEAPAEGDPEAPTDAPPAEGDPEAPTDAPPAEGDPEAPTDAPPAEGDPEETPGG